MAVGKKSTIAFAALVAVIATIPTTLQALSIRKTSLRQGRSNSIETAKSFIGTVGTSPEEIEAALEEIAQEMDSEIEKDVEIVEILEALSTFDEAFSMPDVTNTPTEHHTLQPSGSVASSLPTFAPTDVPSDTPSLTPTAPSSVNGNNSTAVPSLALSDPPSAVPTATPTELQVSSNPTVFSSMFPSPEGSNFTSVPSEEASLGPTDEPTNFPTDFPTRTPTVPPSEHPSNTPSIHNSAEPSNVPTLPPTVESSSTPTLTETEMASVTPSQSPTSSASLSPTSIVSEQPSSSVTENGSVPSMFPTGVPSEGPTAVPSDTPTIVNSDAPTVSSQPSLAPTGSPTVTMAPTVTPTLERCGISADERILQILVQLVAVGDATLIADPSTPQGAAAEWLIREDLRQLCPGEDKLIQRWVTAVLYFSSGGDNWFQCSATGSDACGSESPFVNKRRFLSESNECQYAGITCNADSCITEIEFESNNLNGTIPTEIGLLSDLAVWGMERGSLQGTIPTEVGRLSNLIFLDLDFNELTGTLPVELFNLTLMTQLDLNDNYLEGNISQMGSFVDLEFLQIHSNFFTGTVPEVMGNMAQLGTFTLHDTALTGSVPSSICNLLSSNGGNLMSLIADCGGTTPEIECECCTSCRGS